MNSDDELLFQGKRFQIVRRIQPLVGRSSVTKEVIVHPGAVVILPWVDDDHICLIRNFRISVGETLLELPAGTLEPPEPPLESAHRELIEETGYQCRAMTLMSEFYASPGIMSERMYLYSATGLTPGEQALEAGEEIETAITPWKDAVRMAVDGTIRDAKSMVGILLCEQLRRCGEWPRVSD